MQCVPAATALSMSTGFSGQERPDQAKGLFRQFLVGVMATVGDGDEP